MDYKGKAVGFGRKMLVSELSNYFEGNVGIEVWVFAHKYGSPPAVALMILCDAHARTVKVLAREMSNTEKSSNQWYMADMFSSELIENLKGKKGQTFRHVQAHSIIRDQLRQSSGTGPFPLPEALDAVLFPNKDEVLDIVRKWGLRYQRKLRAGARRRYNPLKDPNQPMLPTFTKE